MKDPEHPVRPAFGKASDPLAAWRAQQQVALTAAQRSEYENLKREEKQRRESRARELDATRLDRVNEEKRRLLLDHPELALRLLPTKAMRESKAMLLAAHTVHRRDLSEIQSLHNAAEARADDYLHQADHERRTQQRATVPQARMPAPHQLTPQQREKLESFLAGAKDITATPAAPDLARAFNEAAEKMKEEREREDFQRAFRDAAQDITPGATEPAPSPDAPASLREALRDRAAQKKREREREEQQYQRGSPGRGRDR